MDGYAVAMKGFGGDGPWELEVRGESRSGHPAPVLAPGCACRIFTGAELPEGSDSVVIQEDVERHGDRVRFLRRPGSGDNIRRAGEDLRSGAVALESGTRLRPGGIALATSLDRTELFVARRPRVAILSTGDELRSPGDPPRRGSIPDSNGIAVAALARAVCADVDILPRVGDDAEQTAARIGSAARDRDLIVTIGGASVGEHDVVRTALERLGAELDFWKVRIRPGKPLAFGRLGATLLLGLPGNPVSAQLTFLLFGVPLLRALQGDRRPRPRFFQATLGAPLRHPLGRRGFYRARWERDGVVVPLENQASGASTSLAWAELLIVMPETVEVYEAGTTVSVLLLDAT
jgi:molybdopterin molybdotransferase